LAAIGCRKLRVKGYATAEAKVACDGERRIAKLVIFLVEAAQQLTKLDVTIADVIEAQRDQRAIMESDFLAIAVEDHDVEALGEELTSNGLMRSLARVAGDKPLGPGLNARRMLLKDVLDVLLLLGLLVGLIVNGDITISIRQISVRVGLGEGIYRNAWVALVHGVHRGTDKGDAPYHAQGSHGNEVLFVEHPKACIRLVDPYVDVAGVSPNLVEYLDHLGDLGNAKGVGATHDRMHLLHENKHRDVINRSARVLANRRPSIHVAVVFDGHDVAVKALGGLVHEEAVVRSDDDVHTGGLRFVACNANAFVQAIDDVHHLASLATLRREVHRAKLGEGGAHFVLNVEASQRQIRRLLSTSTTELVFKPKSNLLLTTYGRPS